MSVIQTVILAAGKGTRMKSDLPKLLHKVAGKPLVVFAVEKALSIKSRKTVLVVQKDHAQMKKTLKDFINQKLNYVVQEKQLGTGHALTVAVKKVGLDSGHILVLNADMPFISLGNIRKLIQLHKKRHSAVSLLTAEKYDPAGLGRIVRDDQGNILFNVEHKDASSEQKKITEVNLGVYLFDAKFLNRTLAKLKTNNKQKEYYLTDLIELAVKSGRSVSSICLNDDMEMMGINTRREWHDANDAYYEWRRWQLRDSGVRLVGEEVFVDDTATIKSDVILESPCYVKGCSQIGKGVVIETGCVVKNTSIGEGTHIKAHSYLDESVVKKKVQIGPFAHLRPGSVLENSSKVGNFVETKKSKIGEGSKVNHLSYIGDATLGKKVNVGAGTITCNYDGKKKLPTKIGDGAFIGSDTQLIAPVNIGKGAYIGAGATITKDVSSESLALSRIPQKEIKGWAKRK